MASMLNIQVKNVKEIIDLGVTKNAIRCNSDLLDDQNNQLRNV